MKISGRRKKKLARRALEKSRKLATADTESRCELCPGQHGLFWDVTKFDRGFVPLDETIKLKLFREACSRCDTSEAGSVLRICEICRHLRIKHLLVCYPEDLPEYLIGKDDWHHHALAFDIRPPRVASKHCDFCQFLGDKLYPKRINDLGTLTDALSFDLRGIVHKRCQLWINKPGHFTLYAGTESTGWYAEYSSNFDNSRQRVREYIDWGCLRYWLKDSVSGTDSDPGGLQLQEPLQNVRVVDVSRACITRLPSGAEYVALSYVWGSTHDGHAQRLKTTNTDLLEQPGELNNIALPTVIWDAMIACEQLEQQFLWVDRLCIVQDEALDVLLEEQLNQMAAIYHQATLTLVAAGGVDATQGLAGVSYARDSKQTHHRFDESFELVECTPSLEEYLDQSKWAKRGWTYQEYLASKRLLFFTEYGVFSKGGLGGESKTFAEGAAVESYFGEEEKGLRMIEAFSEKELTYATDILRASSGILQAIYGPRTSFGMPWDDFSSAILWTARKLDREFRESTAAHTFPTWSWASSNGGVRLPECRGLHSLAYWGRIVANGMSAQGSLSWSTLPPAHDFDVDPSIENVVAGLAWLHGCIRSKVPEYLSIDCSSTEYIQRLADRWNTSPSQYWNDAFQDYEKLSVFEHVSSASLSEAGCLLVHTQKTSFDLDWRGSQGRNRYGIESLPGHNPIVIRSKDHGVAGSISIGEHSAQLLRGLDTRHAEFIALSVGDIDFSIHMMEDCVNGYFSHLAVSDFYGCPGAVETGEVMDTTHINECPQHPDFRSCDPIRSSTFEKCALTEDARKERELAWSHHLARVGYHDVHRALLHERERPPHLWVMLIIPSSDNGEERKVYQRLGIGTIYLKSWVEASPSFETIVLV
jgi:hypothetical protein